MKTAPDATGPEAPTAAPVPAPAPSQASPSPCCADLAAALAGLVDEVTKAVGAHRPVKVGLTIEIGTGGKGMSGGGPPVNPDGAPLDAPPKSGTFKYTNSTGGNVWLYSACPSTLQMVTSFNAGATAIFPISLAQAHVNGAAFTANEVATATGLAYRLADQDTISFTWQPSGPSGTWPRFWWAPA